LKLVCYDAGTGPRCGVFRDERIVGATELLDQSSVIRVEVSIEGLGTLTTTVGPRELEPSGYRFLAPSK
jgi:hypothetical protein